MEDCGVEPAECLPRSESQRRVCCYNSAVFKTIFVIVALAASVCLAQENGATEQKPEVKVHMLNACTPSADEQQELLAALGRIPREPVFSKDYEVDRGRSVLDQNANPLPSVAQGSPIEATVADFVRVRHDLNEGNYSSVQYSFSRDSEQMVETLVFRVRDPKDLLQVSIEDSASAVTPAATMLTAATPASRIKLERFGKSSVVLARCSAAAFGPAPDQSRYEPIFTSASSVLLDYRGLFRAKTLVPEELSRIRLSGGAAKPAVRHNGAKHP